MNAVAKAAFLASLLTGMLGAESELRAEDLRYKSRAKPARYEGVIPNPVSGYDVELLSARVFDAAQKLDVLPETLQVRLATRADLAGKVDLVVRELENKNYYRLDKVSHDWSKGTFGWSSGEVLRGLGGLTMADLGVVAWFDPQQTGAARAPSRADWVIPVMFYGLTEPRAVSGYAFTLKLAAAANVSCEIAQVLDAGKKLTLHQEEFKNRPGQLPLTFVWADAKAPAGDYRLIVSGSFATGKRISPYVVNFKHDSNLFQ